MTFEVPDDFVGCAVVCADRNATSIVWREVVDRPPAERQAVARALRALADDLDRWGEALGDA